jgi:fatty-acyl-CoA synthase
LPAYARPVFVRLLPRVETTSTFKPIKTELARAGFDPALVDGPLFICNPAAGGYVALGPAVFQEIQCGQLRI